MVKDSLTSYAISTFTGGSDDNNIQCYRHSDLIVEWFLWKIEHTNRSLDNSMQCFAHHDHYGQNVALNYQVTCWCAQSPKGTILLAISNVLKQDSHA